MCAECFVRGKITKMHVKKFLRASTLKYTQRPRTLAEGVATLFQGVRDYRDSALILDSVAPPSESNKRGFHESNFFILHSFVPRSKYRGRSGLKEHFNDFSILLLRTSLTLFKYIEGLDRNRSLR